MYCEVSHDIQIEVEPRYVAEHSSPEHGRYVYAYRIRITNIGDVETQLMSRHWVITDANGEVHEVRGSGVVGEQPVIAPGHAYEYSSFCPLPTPSGKMWGTYRMVDENGRQYDVRIPLFFLRDSRQYH